MSQYTIYISLLVAICIAASNSIPRFSPVTVGRCPQLPPQVGFTIKQFAGVWYPAADLSSQYTRCQEFNMTATSKFEMKIDLLFHLNPRRSLKFSAKAITPNFSNPGHLYWSWNAGPSSIVEEFTVLDTDYDNYAVIFLCYDFRLFHKKSFVVLSRANQKLNSTYINRADKIRNLHYHSRRSFREFNECYDGPRTEISIDNVIHTGDQLLSGRHWLDVISAI